MAIRYAAPGGLSRAALSRALAAITATGVPVAVAAVTAYDATGDSGGRMAAIGRDIARRALGAVRMTVDPRLVAALVKQHALRETMLASGATHVGWKLGVGDRESIDGDIAIGFLTSATHLAPRETYVPRANDHVLHADVELFVEFGHDVPADCEAAAIADVITSYGVALEIVDLSPLPTEPDSVVEANVFHRAVAFGPASAERPRGAQGAAVVSGRREASAPVAVDIEQKLARAARLLAAVGERFRRGDRVITGSIVQVRVECGDEVVGAISRIGQVALDVEG